MRGLTATLRSAFAEAGANRPALGAQMTVMFVNDVVWVVFWVLFFHRVGAVHGWDVHLMMLLLAVLTTAGGITLGVVANARRVGHMAVAGELDPVLTLPVPPLAYVLLRRVEPVNLGDLAFGLVLFVLAGRPTPVRVAVFVGAVLASSVLLTAFLVLTGSLAFFLGRNEGGELGMHAMILLGAYPIDVFAGAAKLVLYTVVPAAFVATVPARLIDAFDPARAVALVVVAAVFAGLAWLTFSLGLRRYTSGSVWTRA